MTYGERKAAELVTACKVGSNLSMIQVDGFDVCYDWQSGDMLPRLRKAVAAAIDKGRREVRDRLQYSKLLRRLSESAAMTKPPKATSNG